MDALRKREKKLAEELEEDVREKDELEEKERSINSSLSLLYSRRDRLNAKYKEVTENLENKGDKIKVLEELVKKYKEDKEKKIRLELEKEYKGVAGAASKIHFDLDLEIFKKFRHLKALETSKFKRMDRKIGEKYAFEKKKLKVLLEKEVDSKIKNQKELHSAFFYLGYMKKYDENFGTDIFVDSFFKKISNHFGYHFLSDKETNRLDKPEWMFDFMLQKFEEYYNIFNLFGRPFDALLGKIERLVSIKSRELGKCTSSQKRGLIWHFTDEFIVFTKKVLKKYEYGFDSTEVCGTLLENEKREVERRLAEVHEMSYDLWWKEYRKLAAESLCFYRKYKCIEERNLGVFVYLLENIIESCRIFIDQMRFISKSEVKALCYFYSEMESFKNFIDEEENEILLQSSSEVEALLLQKSSSAIIRFNQENLKLLKLLIENDISKLLKPLKDFACLQEDELVSFLIDLSSVLQSYETCSSYSTLKLHVQKQLDSFLLNQIILRYRMDSEHYLRFRDFFKRLKHIFEEGTWNTDVGLQCIECIFSGGFFKEDSHLSNAINSLYLD